MKTTLDLPDALVKEVKLRPLHDGQKLKDAVAELLRVGLKAPRRPARKPKRPKSPRVKIDPRTGLPVIQCRHPAQRGDELTPDRVAEIILAQEEAWLRGPG